MSGGDPELHRVLKGPQDAVTSVAFCGTSAKCQHVVSGCADGQLMVWNLAQQRAYRYHGHQAAVTSVAYSQTHNLVASASKDCTVRLWRPTHEGRSTMLKAHSAAVRSCAFSNSGSMLVTCSDDKSVKVRPLNLPSSSHMSIVNGPFKCTPCHAAGMVCATA
jgi:centriolar protein POC1